MADNCLNDIKSAITNMHKALNSHQRVHPEVTGPAKELAVQSQKLLDLYLSMTDQLKSQIDNYRLLINDTQTDNNEKLQKILDKLESTPANEKPTPYNVVAQNPPKINYKTVLVKPKNNLLNPPQTKEAICNSIPACDIKCNQISINKTNVAFKFSNENSKNKFLKSVSENPDLNTAMEAYEPTPKCPTIKLKNIDYSTNESDIINQLIMQNDMQDLKNHIKLLFTIKKRHYFDAILCVSPHVYDLLFQRTLFIGWSACIAEQTFLLGHCSNCLSFQHRTKDCPNKSSKKCKNCGISFSTTRINNQQSEFITHIKNCSHFNCCHCAEKNLPAEHPALTDLCPLYCNKIKQTWDRTCYDSSTKVKFFNKLSIPNVTNNNPSTQSPSPSTP
uniref:Uncharacterized protein LOC113794256 n=1 Tax=Dermatophagoides pteronyssinus TaxID=6956 RepID=A0A6P6Y3U9_DERPT|nr:uncharacterized protein LOC113794256 [Dermatophagoides pteronyssinus]